MVLFSRRTVFVFLLGLLVFSSSCLVSEAVEGQPANQKLTIGLEGGGVYQRRDSYHLIQTQDEIFAAAAVGTPFEHDANAWGGFGTLIFGYVLDEKSGLRLSIGGAEVGTTDLSQVPGGSVAAAGNPTNTSLMPFLDASTHSGQQAVEIGGDQSNANALADLKFTYKSTDVDVQLDFIREMKEVKGWGLDAVLGVAYAYFDQEASFSTTGVDYDNSNPTYTYTSETLRDNLVGLKAGLKGGHGLTKDLRLNCSMSAGFYYRMTNFKGQQSFDNASLPFSGVPTDYSIGVSDSDNNFVPRLQLKVALAQTAKTRYCLEVFYAFDGWWNMTSVDNPTVRYQAAGSDDLVDHAARIAGDDAVFQHYIGLKLSW